MAGGIRVEPARELKLYIPSQLIRQTEGDSFVWVADRSAGIAKRAFVEVGLTGAGGLVEVVSGLTVASRVIATGSEGLRDGDRIRITGEDATGFGT